MPRRLREILEQFWPILLVVMLPYVLRLLSKFGTVIARAQAQLKEAEERRSQEMQAEERLRGSVQHPPAQRVARVQQETARAQPGTTRAGAEPKDLVTYLGELVAGRDPRVAAAPRPVRTPKRDREAITPSASAVSATAAAARRARDTAVRRQELVAATKPAQVHHLALRYAGADLRKAIIWSELLAPPLGLRPWEDRGGV
ncbi:MAG: hypothetical protein L0Z55_03735 [Planctomycetes bacterium]|nr:hypothetical protein [Planctomycetota bacterium]